MTPDLGPDGIRKPRNRSPLTSSCRDESVHRFHPVVSTGRSNPAIGHVRDAEQPCFQCDIACFNFDGDAISPSPKRLISTADACSAIATIIGSFAFQIFRNGYQQRPGSGNDYAFPSDFQAAFYHRLQAAGANDIRQCPARKRKKSFASTGCDN